MLGVMLGAVVIVAGTLVAIVDPVAGIALMVVGGLAAAVMIWTELS